MWWLRAVARAVTRRQIMLEFLPMIADALNAKGKAPIFSMVNSLREPMWDGQGA